MSGMSPRQKAIMARLDRATMALMEKYPGAGKLSEETLAAEAAGLPVSQEDQDKIQAIAAEWEETYRQAGRELGLPEKAIEEFMDQHRGKPGPNMPLLAPLEGSRRTGGSRPHG